MRSLIRVGASQRESQAGHEEGGEEDQQNLSLVHRNATTSPSEIANGSGRPSGPTSGEH
jgi:hypothetical protein